MTSTHILASGRELAAGLEAVFVVAAILGVAAIVAFFWTIKLVRIKAPLDTGQRHLLFRLGGLQLIAGLATVGTWVGIGAKLTGDDAKLIPLAVTFLVMGMVAVRRASKAGYRPRT